MTKKNTPTKKARHGLTDKQRKGLMLDIQGGGKTGELAKKYNVSRKTIERAKASYRKQQENKEPSILDMKLALETAKADSMLMHLMERMLHNTTRMEKNEEKYPANKCLELNIKTAEIILLIRNSLAFSETPQGTDDYDEKDVEIAEWLLDSLPEDKKEEMLVRFTDKTPNETENIGKDNPVQ